MDLNIACTLCIGISLGIKIHSKYLYPRSSGIKGMRHNRAPPLFALAVSEHLTWRHGSSTSDGTRRRRKISSAFPRRTLTYRRSKISTMWRPSLCLAAMLAIPAQALHFFIDGAVQKCFFEELPKDTLVVGRLPRFPMAIRNLQTHKSRPLRRQSLGRQPQDVHLEARSWPLPYR